MCLKIICFFTFIVSIDIKRLVKVLLQQQVLQLKINI